MDELLQMSLKRVKPIGSDAKLEEKRMRQEEADGAGDQQTASEASVACISPRWVEGSDLESDADKQAIIVWLSRCERKR